MRAVSFPFLLAFFFSATQSQAAAPDLPEGTTILVQSSQLGPGWHIGRVELVREGCAMIRIPDRKVSGGPRVLAHPHSPTRATRRHDMGQDAVKQLAGKELFAR